MASSVSAAVIPVGCSEGRQPRMHVFRAVLHSLLLTELLGGAPWGPGRFRGRRHVRGAPGRLQGRCARGAARGGATCLRHALGCSRVERMQAPRWLVAAPRALGSRSGAPAAVPCCSRVRCGDACARAESTSASGALLQLACKELKLQRDVVVHHVPGSEHTEMPCLCCAYHRLLALTPRAARCQSWPALDASCGSGRHGNSARAPCGNGSAAALPSLSCLLVCTRCCTCSQPSAASLTMR